MGRSRGSKRRGAQETDEVEENFHARDDDPEFSPPSGSRYPKRITRGVARQFLSPSSGNPHEQSVQSGSRYPTRSSRGVVPQLLSHSSGSYAEIDNDNPSHSRSLEQQLRFLEEARVIPKLESQNYPSQPPHDPVCGISEDNVKLSPPTGSYSSAPFSQPQLDIDNFCAKLVSRVEETDQVTPQPLDLNGHSQQQINLGGFEGTVEVAPQLRDVNGDSQHPRENNVVSRVEVMQEKIITKDVGLSGHCFSPAHSLNLTQFAHDDSDVDPDEVESAPGPSYGIVHGHRVKIEFAPLLTKIFQKYGDITMESNAPSFILERLCTVYQRLEQRDFFDLTRLEINEMLRDLDFIESQKINIGWLLVKVKEISEAKSSLKTYTMLKDEVYKCTKFNGDMSRELERQRMHIALIQKKVFEGEDLMVASEAKFNEYTKKLLDIKTRVKALANKPLVHDIL